MEEMFIEVKAAFDRLVELNEQFDGNLLVDPEQELAEQMEKDAKRQQMLDLKMKIALSRKEKNDINAIEIQKLELQMKE